jgi:serine-type D-Ala-D-Ala carboxypeptidase (penicillin-binding protein 5/6)
MGRRIVAVILVVLAISIAIMTPVLALTPVGSSLLNSLAAANPTETPTPAPLILPTPTPSRPVLTVVGQPPAVNARAAYLLDAGTGNTLDDFHGEIPLPMASTTKIMTAIIAIQTTSPDLVITIHQDALDEVSANGGSSADLVAGDRLTLKDLLYGLMLPSGDDAAIAIADAISGSPDKFVNVMNILAYRLHLYQTHYINPDGLTYYSAPNTPLPGHYTTAYDLVRLAQYAMALPLFAQIVKTGYYNLPATTSHHAYKWVNTNDLLGTHPTEFPSYAGVTGIKTGFTTEAGYCLVFSATRSGHNLIGVVLFDTNTNTVQRFHDAQTLLNWGFGLPLKIPNP